MIPTYFRKQSLTFRKNTPKSKSKNIFTKRTATVAAGDQPNISSTPSNVSQSEFFCWNCRLATLHCVSRKKETILLPLR